MDVFGAGASAVVLEASLGLETTLRGLGLGNPCSYWSGLGFGPNDFEVLSKTKQADPCYGIIIIAGPTSNATNKMHL